MSRKSEVSLSSACRGESSLSLAEPPNWSFSPLEVAVEVLMTTHLDKLNPILREKDVCDEEGPTIASEFIYINTC